MIITVKNEAPFQVLSGAFTIGPSPTGYDLQVGATSKDFTTLFSVGANTPRMVTNVANGSYFRLKNNVGDVKVNWERTCVTEGGGGDMSNYYTKDETDAAISSSTSPIQEQLDDVERVTASALTELHQDILDLSGATPTNSPIIHAINTQAEYEAISGDVKTGDLIQVHGVVLDGYDGPQYGLFEAAVEEEESDGVVRKLISWSRKDNSNSVFWSEDYPWMAENGIQPIDFFGGSFLIAVDELAAERGEDEYNGIGFDFNGKPVITHIVPQYENGEITGITREDTPIGPDQAKEQVIATALVDLDQRKVESQDVHTIVKLTQAEYDLIANPDPDTLYIIVNQ